MTRPDTGFTEKPFFAQILRIRSFCQGRSLRVLNRTRCPEAIYIPPGFSLHRGREKSEGSTELWGSRSPVRHTAACRPSAMYVRQRFRRLLTGRYSRTCPVRRSTTAPAPVPFILTGNATGRYSTTDKALANFSQGTVCLPERRNSPFRFFRPGPQAKRFSAQVKRDAAQFLSSIAFVIPSPLPCGIKKHSGPPPEKPRSSARRAAHSRNPEKSPRQRACRFPAPVCSRRPIPAGGPQPSLSVPQNRLLRVARHGG